MKKRKLELYITGKLMSALMVGRPAKANKAEIAAAAKRRWKQVGKNVKP